MAGMLAVFAMRIIIELLPTWHIGLGILALLAGGLLARITARHFGHGHHHRGDSVIDAIPVLVLLFANIAHPAIDGFSAVETFHGAGVVVGVLYGLSVILHEAVRQSAFITALTPLHINWKWVVGTALFGITLGVAAGIGGTQFFGRYELAADIATLFSYSFVIAEFASANSGHRVPHTRSLFIGGVLLGIALICMTTIKGLF
jgi:hypothetical protein